MSRIATRIRGYVNGPPISEHYGEWGALRPDQRRQIRELCDTCDMFEKAADEFAKQSRWISVDERLPEEYETILCFDGSYVQPSVFLDGEFIEDDKYEGDPIRGVTHWMPLPEAPKGGAECE